MSISEGCSMTELMSVPLILSSLKTLNQVEHNANKIFFLYFLFPTNSKYSKSNKIK